MKGIEIMNYSKKVLVTGATGLIGKELAKPLQEEGFDVYALTIDENNVDNGIHWIKGDLFDKENIKLIVEKVKPEYLLNMAWATTGDYLKSDINYKFLNAGINILEHFKDNGGRRAVFAGTCFEYKFKDEPLKEIGIIFVIRFCVPDRSSSIFTLSTKRLRAAFVAL